MDSSIHSGHLTAANALRMQLEYGCSCKTLYVLLFIRVSTDSLTFLLNERNMMRCRALKYSTNDPNRQRSRGKVSLALA